MYGRLKEEERSRERNEWMENRNRRSRRRGGKGWEKRKEGEAKKRSVWKADERGREKQGKDDWRVEVDEERRRKKREERRDVECRIGRG